MYIMFVNVYCISSIAKITNFVSDMCCKVLLPNYKVLGSCLCSR